MTGAFHCGRRGLACAAIAAIVLPGAALAGTISFQVDPTTIDANNDGFITGNEFQPIGMDGGSPDGVVFDLEPTNNLVSFARFLLSPGEGLKFGGGGGSTLTFDFTVNADIELISYTLADSGFILDDPTFDIREGAAVLSASNTAVAQGDTHNFAGGPVSLDAGTTYSFVATTVGPAVVSNMASWQYRIIPEPASLVLLAVAGLLTMARRHR